MDPNIESKIKKYLKSGENSFSTAEKIVASLCYPELFDLLPEQYKRQPLRAYFKLLDDDRRGIVREHYRGQDT